MGSEMATLEVMPTEWRVSQPPGLADDTRFARRRNVLEPQGSPSSCGQEAGRVCISALRDIQPLSFTSRCYMTIPLLLKALCMFDLLYGWSQKNVPSLHQLQRSEMSSACPTFDIPADSFVKQLTSGARSELTWAGTCCDRSPGGLVSRLDSR